MEEDSPKFDIVTVLIIIAILVMGYFLYKSSVEIKWNDENETKNSSSETNNELELLTISSTISEDCEFLLNEYLYLIGISEGSPKELLIELNLLTNEEFQNLYSQNLIQISGKNYIKTNISYESLKNKLLDYVTENLLSEAFSKYKDYNGFVAVAETGTTDTIYEIDGMELISYKNNLYTFNVEYTIQPSNGKSQIFTVTFLEKNGNYIISDLKF